MYIGTFGDGIAIEPVGRFDNHPVERNGRYVWDLERLLGNLRAEIDAVASSRNVDTVAVDT